MSSLVAFKSAGLPSVQSLSTALRVAAQQAAPNAGVVIVKMDKFGCWVFGADQTEVEAKSRWAVNPYSFVHGYIAWGADKTPAAGTVLGEKLAPMTEPLPEIGPSPENSGGWQLQLGFSLKCISGEETGLDGRFTTTSVGGKRAVKELVLAVAEQAEKDQTNIVPIITLERDSYQHNAYGKVFVPVLKVAEWVSIDGPAEADADADEAPADEPKRRRRVAA